ncbi:hypothetical protein Btru_025217 [Bulinus truncatus]|nr:hypothetical protein Btru_025217 [Bulinus truncatus]
MKNYANLIPLLKKRGFINVIQNNEKNINDYGPAGTLLRLNVMKQWWELMVNQQSNVFPIEIQGSSLTFPNQNDISIRDNEKNCSELPDVLIQDFRLKYLQILKLTNSRLPFSIASIYYSSSSSHETIEASNDLKSFLFGGCNKTSLSLQHFTFPSSRNNTFDFWLQLRLSWWKNFSNNPAHFSVSANSFTNGNTDQSLNGANNGAIQKCMNIVYDFPWGTETLEKVHSLGDQPFRGISSAELDNFKGLATGKEPCIPHCIVCETNLESAAAALLVDSFYERQAIVSAPNTSKLNMVLKLHSQISPYQVALAASTTSSSKSNELHHVCHHLEKDFKKSGVSLFNVSDQGSTLDAHLKRNDQLGIQYTVIVTENTIIDGVINIRHRDTQIQNTCHIGSVVEDIKRNLTARLEH